MPAPDEPTRHLEAKLWLKTAFEFCPRRYPTDPAKRGELERCLLRVKKLVRAELEECLRSGP